MFNIILLFIIANVSWCTGVSWQLGLAIGSVNTYKIPPGYSGEDYSNYAAVAQVGNEVAENYAPLMLIKRKLEEN